MEKIFEDKETITYRLQSNCMEPKCAIDIEVFKESKPRFIALYYWGIPENLGGRLQWCWKMLTRGLGYEHEFYIRPEDIKDLIKIIGG